MIKKISICGKGGSGKSVIITLLAKALKDKGYKVLVVDTDESNTGLYKMLDFEEAPKTLTESFGGRKGIMKYWNENRLGDLLSDTIKRKSIITKDGIGLLSIGKIVGIEGCACPLNAVVREFLKIYTPEDNEILLIDTEAGIEHIGRGNEKYVDAMVIVVDPSYESLELSTRAKKLALESDISNKRIHIIINKADDNIYKILVEGLKERELESYVSGSVRFDPYILEASMLGRPIIGYGGDVSRDIENILNRIIEK